MSLLKVMSARVFNVMRPMLQDFTLKRYTGRDPNTGELQHGPAVTIQGMQVNKSVELPEGSSDQKTALSDTQIWTEASVSTEDLLTMPDGHTPRILKVEDVRGADGTVLYSRIYL